MSVFRFLLLCAGVMVLTMIAGDALAQAKHMPSNTIGGTAHTLSKQVVQIPKLISVVAYVLGTAFAVKGLFALRGFIENSDENPLTAVISPLVISALLIFLPYMIVMVMETIAGARPTTTFSSTSGSFSDTGK